MTPRAQRRVVIGLYPLGPRLIGSSPSALSLNPSQVQSPQWLCAPWAHDIAEVSIPTLGAHPVWPREVISENETSPESHTLWPLPGSPPQDLGPHPPPSPVGRGELLGLCRVWGSRYRGPCLPSHAGCPGPASSSAQGEAALPGSSSCPDWARERPLPYPMHLPLTGAAPSRGG